MEKRIVLVVTVNNHPGVLSHITNLFSRRNFNMEGILCAPIEDGSISRMYLLVNEDERIDMIIKQLSKLHDVKSVSICFSCDKSVFYRLHDIVGWKEEKS